MAARKAFGVLTPLRWLGLAILPAGWCVLLAGGWLDAVEQQTLDWRYRARGELTAPVKVVYVDIDATSLDDMGGWPWDRRSFASVAAALIDRAGVRAVGVDVVFDAVARNRSGQREALVDGNVALARYLDGGPPVVLGSAYAETPFRDFGTRPPTMLDVPKVVVRSLFSPFVSAPPPPPRPRRTARELPLLDRDLDTAGWFEPPQESQLNVGEPEPWLPPRSGLIDIVGDNVAWVPAYVPLVGRTCLHMSVELALAYWGLNADAVGVYGDHLEIVQPGGRPPVVVPLYRRQLLEVNWFSRWEDPVRNPRFGFSTVWRHAEGLRAYRPAERQAAEAFFANPVWRGAIVLIGPVDPMLHDLAPTPFDDNPVPRVGALGNAVKTLLAGQFLRRPPPWGEYLLVLALTLGISALAAAGGTAGVRWKLTAALVLTFYLWFSLWSFESLRLVLPVTATVGAAFTTSFAAVAWQHVAEERQKRRLKGMFGAYVPPELVQRLLEAEGAPQLGGHEQDLTVFISDLESFTHLAETLPPDRLVQLMNEYLTACTEIVEEERGTLDKYIGDAVVVMFGALIPLPDHALRACVAAQRVHRRLAELRERWKAAEAQWPPSVGELQCRIGLNSGPALVGNIGSRSRLNYTVMGDNVNLAARMESGARHFGVRTMVTEATRRECERHGGDRVVFRFLDRVIVKGRTAPVPVYEIVGLKEDMTPAQRECIAHYEQATRHYAAREWAAALACLERSAPLEVGGAPNPSLVLRERCLRLQAEPPGPDWDSAYRMTEK
ncbi:MAG: adenylate/guanylate cyclase domain-containing protein [Verrucomicrobia bacterium]|nr:adenylate/guanylate cyclase domain-containing protein [Verrucomicrobiota bacterium]